MANRLILLTLFVCALVSGAADAAPKHPSKTVRGSTTCQKLGSDYESASMDLAMNMAEDMTDNSAIRATMRESQNNSILEKSRITMDLMRGNSCKMPESAPSGRRYLTDAIKCKTDELKQQNALMLGRTYTRDAGETDPCDRAAWQPIPGL